MDGFEPASKRSFARPVNPFLSKVLSATATIRNKYIPPLILDNSRNGKDRKHSNVVFISL